MARNAGRPGREPPSVADGSGSGEPAGKPPGGEPPSVGSGSGEPPAGKAPDGKAPGKAPDGKAPGKAPDGKAAAAADDKKALANEALTESAVERALRLADLSLAQRRTTAAYLVRAKALQRLNRVDEALAALDLAEQLTPRDASVFELRGRILWAVRRRVEARKEYERFLKLEPTGPRAQQVQKQLAEPN